MYGYLNVPQYISIYVNAGQQNIKITYNNFDVRSVSIFSI
jgi:hypothetical protein